MKYSKFLQTGLISLLLATSLGNALGQTSQQLLGNAPLDNTAITMLVKNKISKDDLAYVAGNLEIKSDRSEAIYKKIDSLVSQHNKKDMQSVKKEIQKTLSDLSVYKDVKVSYKYAVPQDLIKEFKDVPGVKGNDSSVAYNSYLASEKCEVSLKLASDNHGRLFEASELSHLSTQEVSKMSQAEIDSTLKETVLHEAAHCLMHSELRKDDFELKFSEKTLSQSPETAKKMSEKIKTVTENLRNNKPNTQLDNMAFLNFNESFADVMSAFARMGDKPTTSSIQEAQDQLLHISHMREESGLTHKTQPAIQNALSKLDMASKMTIKERYVLAKEIASDSIIPSMKIVLQRTLGNSNTGVVAAFTVGAINISDDGKANFDITEEKGDSYDSLCAEFKQVTLKEVKSDQKMGTLGQEIKSFNELVTDYKNPAISTFQKATQNIMEMRNKSLSDTKSTTLRY